MLYYSASIAFGVTYTTEITYVIDMGIITPMIFITYYLAKHENFIGYVLLRMILQVCMAVGVMLPMQTIFQLAAGISIPVPALATKVFIFVLLAVFAVFFDYCLTRWTKFVRKLKCLSLVLFVILQNRLDYAMKMPLLLDEIQ